MSHPRIAYFFVCFPTLSQMFLQREVAGVAAEGFELDVHSLWAPLIPRGYVTPPGVALHYFRPWDILRLVTALPREMSENPGLLADAWHWVRRDRPDTFEKWFMTLIGAIVAVCRASEFRERGIRHFHGAWATGPATAAAVSCYLCGGTFSFGAHAYDIYRHGGDPFLIAKMKSAAFIHTTTEENIRYLEKKAAPFRPPLLLARRGLNYLPPPRAARIPNSPFLILSVARLVEKKGLFLQLAACRILMDRGVSFELQIIGDGPLREKLEQDIRSHGLSSHVTLCGALPVERVREAYGYADIFWHTGIVDAQGDRDGLPNVIPEAMSFHLPVISCNAPGATEAAIDDQTALVVDISDPAKLADAVMQLVESPELRTRLGNAGRQWVEDNFITSKNCAKLATGFRAALSAQL